MDIEGILHALFDLLIGGALLLRLLYIRFARLFDGFHNPQFNSGDAKTVTIPSEESFCNALIAFENLRSDDVIRSLLFGSLPNVHVSRGVLREMRKDAIRILSACSARKKSCSK